MQIENNEDRLNREKKVKKVDISISKHEIGLLNFLRFITSIIFAIFKRTFAITLLASIVSHNIKYLLT